MRKNEKYKLFMMKYIKKQIKQTAKHHNTKSSLSWIHIIVNWVMPCWIQWILHFWGFELS